MKPKILLVDDEQEILELYKTKLEEAGMEVFTASNGEDGIRLAGEQKPDLVLMDVKMPVMDGVEAFEKLKADPATAGLRVAFLTAFSDPSLPDIDTKYAKELGAADFIRKGIDLNELVDKVKGHLGK